MSVRRSVRPSVCATHTSWNLAKVPFLTKTTISASENASYGRVSGLVKRICGIFCLTLTVDFTTRFSWLAQLGFRCMILFIAPYYYCLSHTNLWTLLEKSCKTFTGYPCLWLLQFWLYTKWIIIDQNRFIHSYQKSFSISFQKLINYWISNCFPCFRSFIYVDLFCNCKRETPCSHVQTC